MMTNAFTDKRVAIVRASELGQYAYCPRAWWLQSVRHVRPINQEALLSGREKHEVHGRGVAAYHHVRRIALGVLGAGLLLTILLWVTSRG